MAKAYKIENGNPFNHGFTCPGCECDHGFNTDKSRNPCWEFNGDLEKPTIQPSLLVGHSAGVVCHSFITNGMIQFLGDSTHHLAGQTVPLPDCD